VLFGPGQAPPRPFGERHEVFSLGCAHDIDFAHGRELTEGILADCLEHAIAHRPIGRARDRDQGLRDQAWKQINDRGPRHADRGRHGAGGLNGPAVGEGAEAAEQGCLLGRQVLIAPVQRSLQRRVLGLSARAADEEVEASIQAGGKCV
jgi:hypothetical protein